MQLGHEYKHATWVPHLHFPRGCHTLTSGLKFMVGGTNVNVADNVSTRTKSDFVFKIAHLLGLPWDHHGLFATLSSRLVKIPGHTM